MEVKKKVFSSEKYLGYKGIYAYKIISMYFDIVIKRILDGKKFEFPKGFGRIYVKEFDSTTQRRGKNFLNDQYSLVRPGHWYKIIFDSNVLKRFGMSFRPSEYFVNRLNHVLSTTNKSFS